MAKTVKITLGDHEFEVPRLNVGQIEEMMESVSSGKMRAFDGLRIALRRATPLCEDLSLIECTPAELIKGLNEITAISGVVLAKPGKAKTS